MKRTIRSYFGKTSSNKVRSVLRDTRKNQIVKNEQKIIVISSESEEECEISGSGKLKRKLSTGNEKYTAKLKRIKSENDFIKEKYNSPHKNVEKINENKKGRTTESDILWSLDEPKTIFAEVKSIRTNITDIDNNEELELSSQTISKPNVELESDIDIITPSENNEIKLPYFLQNFLDIINHILSHPSDALLFEMEDMKWINLFLNSSLQCQMLYVRLYNRKRAWLPMSKISYPKIAKDLSPIIKELVKTELFLCNDCSNNALPLCTILSLLSAPDIKLLAKSFQLKSSNKTILQSQITSMCKKQRGIMSKSNMENLVINRALKSLGPCFRISLTPKKVFNRLLLVFDITKGTESDTDYSMLGYNQTTFGRHQQLSTMVMTGMGKVIYPAYTVNLKTQIFSSREVLLEYETAHHYLSDMMALCEVSNWNEALEISEKAELHCKELSQEIKNSSLKLPLFLRSYSPPAVYIKIKSLKVEVLQRLKDYTLASTLLQELLSQEDYCLCRKGHWAERLTLILDQHLRQPNLSLNFAEVYIKNEHVRVGHIFALKERCSKITKVAIEPPYKIAPELVISGRLLPKRMQSGAARFMRQVDENMLLCSVEELALDHYKSMKYTEGIHGEGGTFACYLCLLMWDIIFAADIPDVFRSQYQSHPLDFYSDAFYINRKEKIDQRLAKIEEWQSDDFNVVDQITKTWNENYDVSCVGMNWSLFKSLELSLVQLDLAKCMGGNILSLILRRMIKDFRHTRSGLPDLIVWNKTEYKLVEVKGPGDRLSNNQKMWMDYLMSIEANVEVCRVTAGGSRHL